MGDSRERIEDHNCDDHDACFAWSLKLGVCIWTYLSWSHTPNHLFQAGSGAPEMMQNTPKFVWVIWNLDGRVIWMQEYGGREKPARERVVSQ